MRWELLGRALVRPDPKLGADFWAPAVAEAEGRFYLYYSVGHGDRHHQLRVACSDAPGGPYEDLGKVLLDPAVCPFAIDAHPFRDDDGRWYLFYARDFLDCSPTARAGTALMVAPMKNMTQLEGLGEVVLRARSAWQRFEANRLIYGGSWDWHTLEGPCAWRHGDRYYCFYSGGCWENATYGVDYGIADRVLGPYSDTGSENGPRVLRTSAGGLLGPGHNTVAIGPDGETESIVYHAWDRDMRRRQMYISPLHWTPTGPRVPLAQRER